MSEAGQAATAPVEVVTPEAGLRPPWRLLLVLAAVPLLEAVFRMGRLHPDEVFQSLDPAMHRAFGYGVLAWEWQVGLRNWFVPGVFSWLLQLAQVFGVQDVQARRFVLALPQYALHVAMLAALWRLAARRIGTAFAPWAVVLVALNPLVIFFACRAMSESFSAAFLVWGLERLDAEEADGDWKVAGLGGVLLGFAQVTRYGSAAFIAPALVVLAVQRRWRALGACVAGGVLVALGLGVLDKVTWGSLPNARWGGWWHSFQEYLDFNIIKGKSASFGTSPWHAYLPRLLAPVGLVGVVLWRWSRARVWLFVVPSLVYLVSVSATPHKEDRFLYPMLVLLCVAGAPAVAQCAAAAFGKLEAAPAAWMKTVGARALVVVVVVATLLPAVPALMPLGAVPAWARTGFLPERPELFRLTARASREGTGLVVMNEGLWGSGGAFWSNGSNLFMRNQDPSATASRWWCTCDFPEEPCFQAAQQLPMLNRVILAGPMDPERYGHAKQLFEGAGFSLVEMDGEAWYFARASR
ncbi:MAG: glycosyltransferase family 39 protein [Myxococcaceae bacterium]|nr:glycosyltransferase family 39 protein [Myxococcaceae bacterium]